MNFDTPGFYDEANAILREHGQKEMIEGEHLAGVLARLVLCYREATTRAAFLPASCEIDQTKLSSEPGRIEYLEPFEARHPLYPERDGRME